MTSIVHYKKVVRRSSRVKQNTKVIEEAENVYKSLKLVEFPINVAYGF